MAEETRIIRIVIDSSKAVDGSAAATRALERLERSTTSMDSTLSRMEQSLGRAGGYLKAQLALAIAAVGARLIQMGRDALNAAAGLDELAEQLGITTEGLQALQFSAVQNGVKLEQLETSISKFSQKMGEAAGGSKEMVEALTALGVKNLDVQGKLRPTEALLQDVARAITSMEDPAKRSAAAVDFFGKAGSRMLPMLKDMAGGLDDMAAKAAAAGAMIDGSVRKSLDDMADRGEVAALKFRALFATIAAPIITDSLERVNTMLGEIIGQLERGRQSGEGFWATVLNDSKAKGRIGSGPGALRLSTPAEEEADRRSKLQGELNDPRNAGRTEMIQEDLDRLNRQKMLDRQAGFESQEEWARRIKLQPTGVAPGVSTSTVKGAGGGSTSEDAIAKLQRHTQLELESARALAAASREGSLAVADLEIHYKATKAAQDAYASASGKAKISVELLTATIEEQMRATERAKNLGNFNIQTVELERANVLMEAENRLINANAEDRARELALIRLKNDIQSKGLDENNAKEKEAIDRRESAITQNERLKAQGAELQKANELWTEPLKTALSSIQTTAADAFATMLETGKFSFAALGDVVKKTVIRMIAEFAALAIIRPMLGSLMGGLQGLGVVSGNTAASLGYGGGAGGSGISMPSCGGGGGGGGFGFLSNPIIPASYGGAPGGYDSIGQLISQGSPAGLGGLTWGGGLAGAASIGMGAYGLATSKSLGGKIGGGLGILGGGVGLASAAGLLPMLGAAGGPIGMGIGLLGSLLSSLLGGGEAAPLPPLSGSNARFDPGAGGYTADFTTQNGGNSSAGQFGSVAATINALYAGTGGTVNPALATGGAIWNNQREGTTSTYAIHPWLGSNQLTRDESGDPAQAVDRMIAKMFYMTATTEGALTGASPRLGTALGNKEPESVAAIQSLLALIKTYDALGKVVPSAKSALDEINARFGELTAGANEYGLALAPITAEQKKVTTRFAQDFIDGMLDPLAVQMRALDDQRKDSLASAEYIRDNVKDVYVDMARISDYWLRKEAQLKDQLYGQSVAALEAAIKRLSPGGALANLDPSGQLAGLNATYRATYGQASAGDSAAINRLAGEGVNLADYANKHFAGSPEYNALRDEILANFQTIQAAMQIPGGVNAPLDVNNPAISSLVQQVQTLTQLVQTLTANDQAKSAEVARLTNLLSRYLTQQAA